MIDNVSAIVPFIEILNNFYTIEDYSSYFEKYMCSIAIIGWILAYTNNNFIFNSNNCHLLHILNL